MKTLWFNKTLTAGLLSIGLLCAHESQAQFDGAVYTQTNSLDGNEIVAFGRNSNGSLSHIGNFATQGIGSTEFDGGEGLDPLISADSIITTDDERFLLTVNAGSDTITSFAINNDFSLTHVSTIASGGVGPNSLAYNNGRVYASNIDRDGLAFGQAGVTRAEPNDEGVIVGFTLDEFGVLRDTPEARIELDNRPADVGFSSDGNRLIVTSITAGSAVLPGANAANSVSVFDITSGTGFGDLLGFAANEVNNPEGRNLASAIDFDTTTIGDSEFIVVTEAREFNSVGAPPALPALQSGSVSVYELNDDGSLTTTENDFALTDPSLDPLSGDAQLTACWIDFGPDGATFFVSNAINSTISSFTLNDDGTLDLIETVAAQGASGVDGINDSGPEVFGTTDGFIDLDVTEDGEFLYQLEGLSGAIGVYAVDLDDASLSLVERVTGFLPTFDTQGIVTVSARAVPEPSALMMLGLGLLSSCSLRRRR